MHILYSIPQDTLCVWKRVCKGKGCVWENPVNRDHVNMIYFQYYRA
jgi:hypothetical protein